MPIVASSEGETLSLLTNWNSFTDIKESFLIFFIFYSLGIKRRKNLPNNRKWSGDLDNSSGW